MATQLTKTEYVMLHKWVRRELGKPQECENCGRTDEGVRYDWANISGEYKHDLSDWARLCHSCHMLIDKGKTVCVRGHEYTPDNIYRNPQGRRFCRECKKLRRRKDRTEYEKVKTWGRI